MRRRKSNWRTSAEPSEGLPLLSIGAGLSVAQNYANRRRHDQGSFTYYVRDVLGTTTYATVTKGEDGVIETLPTVIS